MNIRAINEPYVTESAQYQFKVTTPGRSFTRIDLVAQQMLSEQRWRSGMLHVFLRHTSASLLLGECADHDVCTDMEGWMSRLVQDGDAHFRHRFEGDDDMAAHIRNALTGSEISMPLEEGRLLLGRWQGLFLWEHRYDTHERELILTVQGRRQPAD